MLFRSPSKRQRDITILPLMSRLTTTGARWRRCVFFVGVLVLFPKKNGALTMSGKPLRTSMLCKHHWILLVFTIPKLFFFFFLDQYWESYEFFNILLFSGNCRKTLTKIDFPCKVLPNVFYRHFQVFQNCRKMPEDARRCRKTCLVIPRHLTAILRRDCHPSP